MQDTRLLAWSLGHLFQGQSALAQTMKILIYKADHEVFDKFDYDDDWLFLEPRLFAHFAFPNANYSLHQVFEDIQLPPPNDCRLRGAVVPVFNGPPPLLRPMLEGVGEAMSTDPHAGPLIVNSVDPVHLSHLQCALHWIDAHCPWVAEALSWSLRGVLLYQAPSPNSFASLRVHGMVFLNVPDWADTIFFLEDIAHQSAHVIFTAMSAEHLYRYLLVGDATRWCDLPSTPAEDANDERPVYVTLHAVVTYVLICSVLSSVRAEPSLTPRQRHELDGRLALTLRKFKADMTLMNEPTLYGPRGRMLYRRLERVLQYFVDMHGPLARRLDFSNQPYNFCYDLFVELNPMPRDATPHVTIPEPALAASHAPSAEVCSS